MARRRNLFMVLAAFMLLVGLFPAAAAFAQTGSTVVAGGLANPRGITVGPDGSVYVAEAGSGGDQVIKQGDQELKWGYTGQITKIAPDGTKTVIARNLPSADTGEGAAGVHDLVLSNGTIWAVIGGITGGNPAVPGEDSLVRIDASTGVSQTVANIGAYEAQNNPGGFAVDSNLYGMTLGPDNMIYVADAGGNTVYKVDPGTGALSLVAVMPGIPLPPGMQAPPGGNPERGGANELDPVPTGVAFGPDGNLYVSLLSGGPFPPGAARVMQVTQDGKVSVAVGGLTMLTDIKLGPDGNWYAAEFARFGAQGPEPQSGDIVRITPGGQISVVVSGLDFPNKLAFDASGNLYATVNSVTPGGQVIRVNDIRNVPGTTPSQMPTGMPRTGNEATWPLAVLVAGLLLITAGGLTRRVFGKVRA